MKHLALALLLTGCNLYLDGGGPAPAVVDAMPPCTDPAPGCVYGLCDGGTTDICNSECLGVAYGCVDGHWQEVAWCDPPLPDAQGPVTGAITIQETVTSQSATCPTLTPPDQRSLTIVDGSPRTVTVDPPMVLSAGSVVDNGSISHVHAEVTDDWGNGVTPAIVYDTDIAYGGPYSSTATGTIGDCTFTLSVLAYTGGI